MDGLQCVDLPEEIIDLIISFMDGATRRLMQSTSKKWHRKLFNNNFTFYFTNKNSIQSIVEHLTTHYSNIPIGIEFKKKVDIGIKDYAQHLAKLTNLTSLTFDRPDPVFDTEWLRLTTLTNLIYFEQCPMILQPILTQLRSFNYNKIKFGAYENWPRFTNLEKFQISVPISGHIDPFLFIANPTRLTELKIINNAMTTEDFDRAKLFTNLKKLKCYQSTAASDDFQLGLFTSLEYLKIKTANFEGIENLIHLTKLVISSNTQFNMGHFNALTNLKRLSIIIVNHPVAPMQEDQLNFLADLIKLEELKIETRGLTGKFFQWLNSPNFTKLKCWFAGGQPNYFKNLTNLRKLDLDTCERNVKITYDYISELTLLTKFKCSLLKNTLAFFAPFTSLKKLAVPNLYTVSTLPNLESLDCAEVSDALFNEFRLLTKLTALKCHLESHFQNESGTFLSKLPLREFSNRAKISTEEFFSEVSQMTALERLKLSAIDDFSILRDLTRLTYLDCTNIGGQKTKFENLTQLTSLQIIKGVSHTVIPTNFGQHLTRLHDLIL